MPTLSERTRALIVDTWHRFQKAGFWWLIIFILGASVGFKVAGHLYETKFNDAVKLGGILHDNTVYDIKLRP